MTCKNISAQQDARQKIKIVEELRTLRVLKRWHSVQTFLSHHSLDKPMCIVSPNPDHTDPVCALKIWSWTYRRREQQNLTLTYRDWPDLDPLDWNWFPLPDLLFLTFAPIRERTKLLNPRPLSSSSLCSFTHARTNTLCIASRFQTFFDAVN